MTCPPDRALCSAAWLAQECSSAAALLFIWSFMIMLFDDTEILVESEDRACEQKRLRHVVEQPSGHVVDLDHLLSHHHDAAHEEQHRAGILRDFEAFLVFVFHGVVTSMFNGQCPTSSCHRQHRESG